MKIQKREFKYHRLQQHSCVPDHNAELVLQSGEEACDWILKQV
jgi:hypothetical protein